MQETFDIFSENTTTAQPEAKPVKLSKEEARAALSDYAAAVDILLGKSKVCALCVAA